jgi:hypothetical protein
MTGTLHIFLRSVVNGASHYQVNFNPPGSTYAKVFYDPEELHEFLVEVAGLTPDDMEGLWHELDSRRSATLSNIEIPEHETPMLGLKQAPVE